MRTPLILLSRIVVLMMSLCTAAQAVDVPPALSPWQGWVLDQHPDVNCTRVALNLEQRICAWPGRLSLAVSDKGGSFNQSLLVEGAGWIGVPGDREHWPQALTLNGRTVSALERNGLPMLWLERGDYVLRGNFEWRALPQSLTLPITTALLDLNLNGASVAAPNVDRGRLWLRAQTVAADAGAHNSVKVQVFRRIHDDIPRTVRTVLRLSVAGKARELKLGRFLLADAEPIRFDSPLPARIEDDGSLRVQARAGQWEIAMDARLPGDTNTFAMSRQGDDWPAQEVWVFAAEPSLRRVQIDGAPSVDPSQLDLPAGFENLPTWLLDGESKLVLTEQARGDASPPPNELSLDRTVWLDFEGTEKGDGATIRDRISGRLTQGWRLDAQPAVQLGRVSIDGAPRLVTQLDKGGAAGVEIRNPQVNLEALARVDDIAQLNAAGWQTGFNGVQMQLLVPPGWKLWHASGPDRVEASWVSRWNLWAIFLSLLIVAAVLRLLDWRWAIVAALTVALVYHERLGLIVLLLPLLVAIALLRVVDAANARRWIQRIGAGFGALLVLAILAFAVDQVRRALYPQLELPYSILQQSDYEVAALAAPAPAASEAADAMMERKLITTAKPASMPAPRKRYQETDNTQTGPGQPRWQWQPVSLSWSGPVRADQPLHLYVTGNALTRLLKVMNVLLIAALAFGLLRALYRPRPASDDAMPSGVSPLMMAMVAALIGISFTSPAAQAQTFPPEKLLQEFEQRLLRAPACAPDCAAVESALVQVANDQLSVRLRVAVAADLAVPLPTANNWQLRSILVDGLQSNTATRALDGAMLLPLTQGSHDVLVEGPLSSDDIALQFVQRPHIVRVQAPDWDVFGVADDRLAANAVQLQKRQRSVQTDALLPAPAKPFARIRRDFSLGLDWTVQTTVERIAPLQGAINLSVPTLPGESIVAGGVEARDGAVAVSLGSQQRSLSWQSQLQPQAVLMLSAPQTSQWVEIWRIDASERWHIDGSGLPEIRREDAGTARVWQPWPGESLQVRARQPLAVSGATTTVETGRVQLKPGKRSSALELELLINSSMGGDYRIALAEPNVLKSVVLNGTEQAQASRDGKLVLPLVPGENRATLRWELERGTELVTRTPAIELDTVGTNIDLTLELPRDRWPLWVSGPRIGPAMLYWGVLVVIVGVAVALGALTRRFALGVPLRTWQWLLLLVGISTVNTIGSLPVLLWFGALEMRRQFAARNALPKGDGYYLMQVALVLLTLVAAVALASVIPQSLLSAPDMQVQGNGSSNYFYNWYQDRSAQHLPQALVFSVPLWCYRVAMLAWSLWVVFALMRWVKWGWAIFAEGGVWPKPVPKAPPPAAESQSLSGNNNS
jgi:hypothetical protein